MTGKKMLYWIAAAIVIVLVYVGWKMTARSGYETAQYNVVESDGSFEVREYPELMLAATTMEFRSQGDDGSFGRLFRYISGANEEDRKLAMTTPVFMEPEHEDTRGQMGFVIPSKVSAESIPGPSSRDVEIRKRDGGRFAVLRFAGRMNDDVRAAREDQLRAWIDAKGFHGSREIELAGYDPPWTPGPLRRNEILIRLK